MIHALEEPAEALNSGTAQCLSKARQTLLSASRLRARRWGRLLRRSRSIDVELLSASLYVDIGREHRHGNMLLFSVEGTAIFSEYHRRTGKIRFQILSILP